MFGPFVGELFGTFILVLLGDGVVANVGLAPRLAGTAYNWNTITIGWAFAVIIAVYVSGGVSGAHLNPAVTLAMAAKRSFGWTKAGVYIVAQLIGAFLGALAVYLVYRDGLVACPMCGALVLVPSSALASGAMSPPPQVPWALIAWLPPSSRKSSERLCCCGVFWALAT
jgi:glycerol uptake facilitator protein